MNTETTTKTGEGNAPRYRFGFAKQFTKKEWKAMEIVSEPSGELGQIRKDWDGDLWLWKSSGLRVTAQALAINQN